MQDTNVVTIACRLARDPELRSLPSGMSVCELRVAFNTSKKVGDSYEDVGNFINVSVFGKQGESVARMLTKGRQVIVSGRLEHRTWEDKDGNRRETHSIVANSVQFVGPREDAPQGSAQSAARPAVTPAARPAQPAQAQMTASDAGGSDEDVPF